MNNPLKIPNWLYDIAKYTAQVALPALAVFVAAVWPVWGWPNTDAIVKTIVAVDLLLGSLLLISQVQYSKNPQDPNQPPAGTPPGEAL